MLNSFLPSLATALLSCVTVNYVTGGIRISSQILRSTSVSVAMAY